jgi:hypothetical protein
LTSDRPYRPALSTEDAIAVLVERRATMYDPLIVDRFIQAQEELSSIAATSDGERDAMETIATRLRVVPEAPPPAIHDVRQDLPLKALSLLRAITPSPAGVSFENLGLIVSHELRSLVSFTGLAIYCITDKQHILECRYAEGAVAALAGDTEIQLGEKLSGWVAAHRTPIWNSDATLDLESDLAKAAGVTLGSSVPLIHGESVVGALTLYAPKGHEVAIEPRMLVQALAPALAFALVTATEHRRSLSIDGQSEELCEILYTILSGVLSHDRRGQFHPGSTVILLATWELSSKDAEWQQAVLKREVATAPADSVLTIALSRSRLLVVGTVAVLTSMGLWPVDSQRESDDFKVAEIANPLKLREALGLTHAGDVQQTGKRLVH